MGPRYQGSRVSRNDLVPNDDSDSVHDSTSEGTPSDEYELVPLGGAVDGEGIDEDEETEREAIDDQSQGEVDMGRGDESDCSFERLPGQNEKMSPIINISNGEDCDADDDGSSGPDCGDSVSEKFSDFSEGGSEVSTGSSSSPEVTPAPSNERVTLRRMMAESQKSVIAAISAATKADLAKGKAVKQQRSTFDTLLNTRVRLQKSLIAANSFSFPSTTCQNLSLETTIHAAETAAINLWAQLDTLRQSLQDRSSSKKRPFEATLSAPSSALWTRMQTLEIEATHRRRAILSKWSKKLQPPTQLRPSLSTSSRTPLPTLLDQHLSTESMARNIERTRTPRSCAPLQASTRHALSDATIYDDSEFYTLLLRDLVDRRMGDSVFPNANVASAPIPAITTGELRKVKRHRPNLDTKASKGRKMRYTVHEKLRDFMICEDRGTWGEKQVTELFGNLLGRKIAGLNEGEEDEDMDTDIEGRREEEGLMLFRR